MIRYAILGPLAVDGATITAGRDRVVLAMLLLHAGRVVGASAIIEAVWGDDPPPTARGQLQTCVSRLRRALPDGVIESDPAGYRIRPEPGELDAEVFADRLSEARDGGGPEPLRTALDLWRGDALAEIDSPAVRRLAAVLDERRAVAIEDWAEAEIAAGHARDLIGALTGLVERYPLRERLRGLLMTALARSGRVGDALAEYRRARDVLSAELGIDPGAELADVHRQILAGEPEAPPPAARPIRCLPRTVGDFTGREEVVERLLDAIRGGRRPQPDGGGPFIAVVDGMAGSGKTTLAVHLATLVGDHYPDAHLFVDLHGHSEREPLDPGAALLVLLRQLGIGADRIPAGRDERVARWRTELAARRAVVVLDNAASSAQLADLLPASPGTLVLVTSRRRLIGLDGVHAESLALFTEDEAVALLARIAGARVAAEPGAAVEVVRRCGALPLALRLAGARLAHRPRWRVADLVRRIGSSALPELAAEDRSVAGAFALSFGQLPAPAQRVFRLLGVHPGGSVDGPAAAALADLPLDDAEDVLDDLHDVHLVEEPEPGVFRLHDLLREYAAALAAELPGAERREAVVRVLDLELHAALATVTPARLPQVVRELRDPVPARPDLVVAVTEPAARLERVRPALGALLEAAVEAGHLEYAWQLPRAAWLYLVSRGYLDDIASITATAREVAVRLGDRAAQAVSANYLASTFYLRGRYEEARSLLDECIRLREEIGDRAGLAVALGNFASICNLTGRFIESERIARRAIRLGQRSGSDVRIELMLDSLSTACSALGRHDEAIRYQRRRLLAAIDARDEFAVLQTMEHLVMMRRRAGGISADRAERTLRFVLRRMARQDDLSGEPTTRAELGDLLRERRRYPEAVAELRASLAKIVELGDTRSEALFANMLARAEAEAGDVAAATVTYRRALTLARTRGQALEEARAELGLGDCLAAPEHWHVAHQIFTRLRTPERFAAADRLALVRVAADGENMEA